MKSENKNLDGVTFFNKPVVNMTADKLLEVVSYLVEENKRLKDESKRHMEIMMLRPIEENN